MVRQAHLEVGGLDAPGDSSLEDEDVPAPLLLGKGPQLAHEAVQLPSLIAFEAEDVHVRSRLKGNLPHRDFQAGGGLSARCNGRGRDGVTLATAQVRWLADSQIT